MIALITERRLRRALDNHAQLILTVVAHMLANQHEHDACEIVLKYRQVLHDEMESA